jgi:hypothetical protein
MIKYFVAKDKGSISICGKLFLEGEEIPVKRLEMLPGASVDFLFEKGLIIEVDTQPAPPPPEKIGFAAVGDAMQPPAEESEPEYEKLSLEELNLLVKEKDPEMEPFETKEEAMAFLRM